MDREIRTTVVVADATGHTELQLTKAETMELIETKDVWVFTGNKLVQAADLQGANWAEVGPINMMPPLVGCTN